MPNLTLTTSPQQLVGSTDGVLIKASSHFTYGFGDTSPSVGIDWSTPQLPLDYKGGRGTIWVWADSVDDATVIYYQLGSEKKAYVFDSNGTPIIADLSGSNRVVSEVQSAVHDGMSFSYSAHSSIAAGSSLILLGRTGSRQVHFDGFKCDISQTPFLIEFFEAPTVTTTGTLQSTQRRNRANTNASQMLVYSNATVSANGTLIDDDQLLLVGQGANVLSGTGTIEDGWVLKANTDYIIKLTNQAASTTNFNAKFSWHEATYLV